MYTKIIVWVILNSLVVSNAYCWQSAFPTYEAYLDYRGPAYPYALASDWSDEAGGVAHDSDHWYISQRRLIYRVPVSRDLDGDFKWSIFHPEQPGVPYRHMDSYPELSQYDHFGDPGFLQCSEKGYLLMPVDDGNDGACALLAVFRGDDSLDLVQTACFEGQGSQAGWLAVHGNDVYSSENHTDMLRKYRVYCERIENGGTFLEYLGDNKRIQLKDKDGGMLELHSMQGGAISDSGRIIYLSNGYNDCNYEDNYGIHVFDMQTGVEIARSSKEDTALFKFQFNSCDTFYEEPEGLTIWDLDNGESPNIEGQLHVLMIANDYPPDDVYMKHFSGKIHVSVNGNGDEGSCYNPFSDVTTAINYAWDGATIEFHGGDFHEIVSVEKFIRLISPQSLSRIGVTQ